MTDTEIESRLEQCALDRHDWLNIHSCGLVKGVYLRFEWCKCCGAIRGDWDNSGRIFPGRQLKLRQPEVTKMHGAKTVEIADGIIMEEDD